MVSLDLAKTTFFGPNLFYRYASDGVQGSRYVPNRAERWGDLALALVQWYWLPPLAWYGYFLESPVLRLGYYAASVFGAVGVAYALRGVGRLSNSGYDVFALAVANGSTALTKKTDGDTGKAKDGSTPTPLDNFDYDFAWRPVDFVCTEPAVTYASPYTPKGEGLKRMAMDRLGGILAAILGRPMMYPGSTAVLQTFVPNLVESRARLVEKLGARRCKVQTCEGYCVDALFYDQRGRGPDPSRAHKLIVSCEGNASFYEHSMGVTAYQVGFSLLGWNHPGFGCSEGLPYPDQEANSVVAIIRYAEAKLGFPLEDIYIFSWSIGCYSVSRAAAHFPNLGGVILDAPFDHVLPLGTIRMPKALEGLVVDTLGRHLNLDVVSGLVLYSGPIRFIRRLRDEMICTNVRNIGSNRGNHLIAAVLSHRYPFICKRDWVLAIMQHPLGPYNPEDDLQEDVTHMLRALETQQPPYTYGESLTDEKKRVILCEYLVRAHTTDVNSTHCELLPANLWRDPWRPVAPPDL